MPRKQTTRQDMPLPLDSSEKILKRLELALANLRQKTTKRLDVLQKGLDNWRSVNAYATSQLGELKSIRSAALHGRTWVPPSTVACPTTELDQATPLRDAAGQRTDGHCGRCGATESSPWYEKRTKCRACYIKEPLVWVRKFVSERGSPPSTPQQLINYSHKALKFAEARDALAEYHLLHPPTIHDDTSPTYVPSFIKNESEPAPEAGRPSRHKSLKEVKQELEESHNQDAEARGRMEAARRARVFSVENATAEITIEHRQEVAALITDQINRRKGLGENGEQCESKEAAKLHIRMKKQLKELIDIIGDEAPEPITELQGKAAKQEAHEAVRDYLKETHCILSDQDGHDTTLQLYNLRMFQGLSKPQMETLMDLVVEEVKVAPRLETVKICMGNLTNSSVGKLCDAVLNNPTVSHLVLDNNSVRDEGFESIIELLEQNRLKTLSMENQTFELSSSTMERLLDVMEANTSLTKLGLTFRQTGMRLRAETIMKRNWEKQFEQRDRTGVKSATPEELVRQYNGSHSAEQFEMMNQWGLAQLRMDVKQEIYCKLAQGIADGEFETVRIVNSKVENMFVEVLCSQLQRSTCVKTLVLDRQSSADNNDIYGEGFVALANLLEANESIESLQAKLQKRDLDHKAAESIMAALEINTTLIKMELDFRKTHTQHKDSCARFLKRNWKLRHDKNATRSEQCIENVAAS